MYRDLGFIRVWGSQADGPGRGTGRDTGGAFSVVECVDAPDSGPPTHVHAREDETFYVLEGEYEFVCGGKSFAATDGLS